MPGWVLTRAVVSFMSSLVVALGGCLPASVTLESFFLKPSAEMAQSPASYNYPYDELYVPVAGDRRVCIWHVKTANPKAVVVIIPGSDKNKSRYLVGLPVFVPHGYDMILMDYEGYGTGTTARPELERLSEDGYAVVRFAQSLHERVVVFGASAGGPTAVRVAADLDLAAVILEAPLALQSEVELWRRDQRVVIPPLWHLANLWVHPQIPDSFDIFKHVQNVSEPKLIM